ncbi:Uncharacterised protein [Mycobacteroides abscessus subsp. abscessus]|nr:Uncharacterised protein [Mycobacteroides abscessus subsp. abscessus]
MNGWSSAVQIPTGKVISFSSRKRRRNIFVGPIASSTFDSYTLVNGSFAANIDLATHLPFTPVNFPTIMSE